MARPDGGPLAVLVMPRIGYMDSLRSRPGLPLSLLQGASEAATRHDLALVDLRLVRDWRRALSGAVGPRTRLVAVTSFTGRMVASALQVTRFAKRSLGLQVAWGGVHATLEPASTLADPDVDAVVSGEGERPFAALLDALADGRSIPEDVPGLLTLRDGEIRGPAYDLVEDLDALPEVPYDLVDVASYLPLYDGRRSFYLQSSRGCPRACRYCYNRRFNRGKWRAQSADRVRERLESAWRRFGFEDVYFLDDSFLVDLPRARRIAEWFVDHPLTWQMQGIEVNDVNRLPEDDLRLLARSGLKRVTLGVETGSARMRKVLAKPGTPDDVRRAILRLRPYDIRVYCSFMAALPGETEEDLRATIALHGELPRLNPNVRTSPIYNFCPYPGTPLFDEAVRLGFVPPARLEGWAGVSWEDGVTARVSGRSQAFWQSLYFASLFGDEKAAEYSDSPWIKAAAALYRPVARWRLEHLEFRGMPEARVARWLEQRLTR